MNGRMDRAREAGRKASPLAQAIMLEVTKAAVRSLAYMAADAAEAHLERKLGKKATKENGNA